MSSEDAGYVVGLEEFVRDGSVPANMALLHAHDWSMMRWVVARGLRKRFTRWLKQQPTPG